MLGGITVCTHLMEAAGLASASASCSSKLSAATSSVPGAHSASSPEARGGGTSRSGYDIADDPPTSRGATGGSRFLYNG